MSIIPTINLPIEVEAKGIPIEVEAEVLLQISFPHIIFHQIKHQVQGQRDLFVRFAVKLVT